MAREKGGFWVGLAALLFYPTIKVLSRWRVEGLDRLPATGPALVVANHISYLDPIYSAVFVHRARRVPRFLAKNTLWKIPIFGNILAGSEQIPVYRESLDAQGSLRAGTAALANGKVVVIYDRYGKKFSPLPRKEVKMRCGDPIDLSAYRGREIDAALLREVTDHLMAAVRELLAEVRAEPAPTTFFRQARAVKAPVEPAAKPAEGDAAS